MRRERGIASFVLLVAVVAGCSATGPGASAPGAGSAAGHSPADPAGSLGGASSSDAVGSADRAGASGGPVALTVFAAASLGNALGAVVPAYEAMHPGVTITVATGASSALRIQVEQGAPADLLLSADTANAVALARDGFAVGSVVPFAGNLLTVVVPLANPAGITTPADLARPGVRIVAAGDQVPISTYAVRVVANLAGLRGYPADFASRYAANVVSHEDDVGAVLAKVALGEGDAAIVYATDARGSSKVRSIQIPPAANVPATYAGVVVRATRHSAEAGAFLAWLAGPAGQAIMARFGFTAAP